MNKYEEALESARETNWYNIWHLDRVVSEQMEIYLDIFEELVEKETPKKPIQHKTRKYKTQPFIWVCPNCDKALPLWFDEQPNEVDAYCGCCGQKLDWSDFDETNN